MKMHATLLNQSIINLHSAVTLQVKSDWLNSYDMNSSRFLDV